MKKVYLLFLAFIITFFPELQAGSQTSLANASPADRTFSSDADIKLPVNFATSLGHLFIARDRMTRQSESPEILQPMPESIWSDRYYLHQRNGTWYARILAEFTEFPDPFPEYSGWIQEGRYGNILFLSIPLNDLEKLAELPGMLYAELDIPHTPMLDSARSDSYVDLLHAGIDLPDSLTGAGVVLGVLDMGFDYTHPSMYAGGDQAGRIYSVWEQQNDNGTPPSGFGYGRELTTQQDIVQSATDKENESHGAHVAAIAGGGYGPGVKELYGFAPASTLVLVGFEGSQIRRIDGIEYVFDIADALGKPAVVNVSWGSHHGPHDGTSILERTMDNLSGEGRILVNSAGNNGSDDLSVHKNFTTQDTILSTFYMPETDTFAGDGNINIRGSGGGSFEVGFVIWDETGDLVSYTPYTSTSDGSIFDTIIQTATGTIEITKVMEASNPFSNRPSGSVNVNNQSRDILELYIKAASGKVVAWNTNYAAFTDEFPGMGPQQGRTTGNSEYSVVDGGGTANSSITVGAHTTKQLFESYQGGMYFSGSDEPGELASFSSHGPSLDQRTKPDVTAPGNTIAAAVNSFDGQYDENTIRVVQRYNDGNDDWWFALNQGTSMSAPAFSGVVAIMLEMNPELDYNDIRKIIKEHSRTDVFTGNIPDEGNNQWGWGKMHALDYVKSLQDLPQCEGHVSMSGLSGNVNDGSQDGQNYSVNQSCTWHINSTDAGSLVFTHQYFNLSDPGDTLYLYSGNDATGTPEYVFTSQLVPSQAVEIQGSDAYLKFVTGNGSTANGWSFDWCGRAAFAFSTDTLQLCTGESVLFDDLPDAGSYNWTGDHDFSCEDCRSPEVTFFQSGEITVNIANTPACVQEVTGYAEVFSSPDVPALSAGPEVSFCEGESVLLEITNSLDASLRWLQNGTAMNADDETEIVINQSGTYQVRAISEEGCESISDEVEAIAHSLPAEPDITLTLAGEGAEKNRLEASAATAYQWYFEDEPIEGATEQQYEPMHAGDYRVRVYNDAGCNMISELFAYETTSLFQTEMLFDISIHPNPAEGLLQIQTQSAAKDYRVGLVDMSGREVPVKREDHKENINLSFELPTGIYMVYVTEIRSGRVFRKQVLIQSEQ